MATVPGVRYCPEIVIHRAINPMHKNFFEVSGHCERDIQCFMNESHATDTSIETGWQEFLLGDARRDENSFIAFGYCQLTRKHLNRLADFHELQLVFVEPELSDCHSRKAFA